VAEVASGFDVVMIDMDAASDLQLVSELCARPGSPAVVALARRGFAGKSLEYVLVMAEVRSVSAKLAGHNDTFEFANAIMAAAPRLRSAAGQERRIA
jgi:ribosomal protein S5